MRLSFKNCVVQMTAQLQFCIIPSNKSSWVAPTSTSLAAFTSSRVIGQCLKTSALGNPRSENEASHSSSPPCLDQTPRKNLYIPSSEGLEMWTWYQFVEINFPRLGKVLRLGSKKDPNLSKLGSDLMMTEALISFQRNKSQTEIAHHTVSITM